MGLNVRVIGQTPLFLAPLYERRYSGSLLDASSVVMEGSGPGRVYLSCLCPRQQYGCFLQPGETRKVLAGCPTTFLPCAFVSSNIFTKWEHRNQFVPSLLPPLFLPSHLPPFSLPSPSPSPPLLLLRGLFSVRKLICALGDPVMYLDHSALSV